MPSIGGFTVTVFDGALRQGTYSYEVYSGGGGVVGSGVVFGGIKAPVSKVVTKVRESSLANAQTDEATVRAQMRTLVTVIDGINREWDSVAVCACETVIIQDALGWVLIALWDLLPQVYVP
jgi:hypothetical protein